MLREKGIKNVKFFALRKHVFDDRFSDRADVDCPHQQIPILHFTKYAFSTFPIQIPTLHFTKSLYRSQQTRYLQTSSSDQNPIQNHQISRVVGGTKLELNPSQARPL